MPLSSFKRTRPKSEQPSAEMAADSTGTTLGENEEEHGCNILKRHARVTVKYNRKELQRRLDVEKWIDDSLGRLYKGQVGGCVPEQENDTAQILNRLHLQMTIQNIESICEI